MTRSRRASLLSVIVLSSGLVGASVAATRGPRPQQSTPGQQAPTFRSGTTYVEVDAIVKDAAGRFVADLVASDFEVVEDGHTHRIETLYLVRGPNAAVKPSGEQAARDRAVPSPSTPPPSGVQRVFVFDFDIEHMNTGGVLRAQKAASEFLATQFHEGDVGGVVAAGTMVGNRLTSAVEDLRASVSTVRPAPDTHSRQLDMQEWPRIASLYEASRVNDGDSKALDYVDQRACTENPDLCGGSGGRDAVRAMVQTKCRDFVSQLRLSAQRTLSTLEQLVGGLARLPGRKTVMFLTDGFYSSELASQMNAVISKAASSNVRIYAVDTRGLNHGSADSSILNAPPHDPVVMAPDLPAGLPQFDIAIDGPNSLAADTGGLYIRNENDFPRALREIADDASSYYVLGYQSGAPRDGRFHPIKVNVLRHGLTVRARKGYVAEAQRAEANAASVAPRPHDNAPAPSPDGQRPPAALVAMTTEPPASEIPTIATVLGPTGSSGIESIRAGTASRASAAAVARLRPGEPADGGSALPAEALADARKGWEAYQRGDTKGALALLRVPGAHAAAPPWVNYVLGWAAFAEGEYVAARNAWNVVRTEVPDFNPVYFDIADAYLRQRKQAEARVVLRAAQEKWPASLEVLNALGVVETSLGQLDEAIGVFEQALTVAPGDTSTRFNRGGARELRFVRALRGPGDGEADRALAVDDYRQVAASDSILAEAARAGLRRLEPIDVRALKCSSPASLATLSQSVLHGRPIRLAWSLDGKQLYVGALGARTEGHVSVSLSSGTVTQLTSAPDWSKAYWAWKAGRTAPWLPGEPIKSESKSFTPFNTTDPGNKQRAFTSPGQATTSNVLVLHGETIAESTTGYVIPGMTFTWSPFAMGALAFVTPRNRLAVIDRAGRKIEVGGARDVELPAWSEDGLQMAYLTRSGNDYVLHVVRFDSLWTSPPS